MPRKYTKKSEYWNKFSQAQESESNIESLIKDSVPPSSAGESYYAEASCPTRNVGQIDQESSNQVKEK